MQRVEGIEKFQLGTFLIGKELNIIDQQSVQITILAPELLLVVVFNRIDVVIGEGFAGNVFDLGVGIMPQHVVGNGLHQMSLAKADTAIDQEWIIKSARLFRGSIGGSIGHLIAATFNESFKCIFWI